MTVPDAAPEYARAVNGPLSSCDGRAWRRRAEPAKDNGAACKTDETKAVFGSEPGTQGTSSTHASLDYGSFIISLAKFHLLRPKFSHQSDILFPNRISSFPQVPIHSRHGTIPQSPLLVDARPLAPVQHQGGRLPCMHHTAPSWQGLPICRAFPTKGTTFFRVLGPVMH